MPRSTGDDAAVEEDPGRDPHRDRCGEDDDEDHEDEQGQPEQREQPSLAELPCLTGADLRAHQRLLDHPDDQAGHHDRGEQAEDAADPAGDEQPDVARVHARRTPRPGPSRRTPASRQRLRAARWRASGSAGSRTSPRRRSRRSPSGCGGPSAGHRRRCRRGSGVAAAPRPAGGPAVPTGSGRGVAARRTSVDRMAGAADPPAGDGGRPRREPARPGAARIRVQVPVQIPVDPARLAVRRAAGTGSWWSPEVWLGGVPRTAILAPDLAHRRSLCQDSSVAPAGLPGRGH